MYLDPHYSFRTIDPDVRAANAEAIEFLERVPMPSSVWLTGRPGRGKTHLARCTLNRHAFLWLKVDPCAQDLVYWISGPKLRDLANCLPEDREEGIRHLCRQRTLLIDDLDKADMTNAKPLEVLWTVLDGRYKCGRKTIVTSNMSGKALAEIWARVCLMNPSLPGAIMDRLMPCKQFEIQGVESFRRKVKEQEPEAPTEPVEMATPEEIREAQQMVFGNAYSATQA